jgi:hypothetical protein
MGMAKGQGTWMRGSEVRAEGVSGAGVGVGDVEGGW